MENLNETHDDELSALQKKLLDMLKWLHNFCLQNGIRYFCLGGTMLGAVRHKGFIPWDDDVDIGLPRKDYEKLLNLLGGKIKNHYYLESYQQGNEDFTYSYAKLYDTNTIREEIARNNIRRGIYIDIFPLDGIGNSLEEAKNNYHKILPWLNLLAARSCAIREGRSGYKNFAIHLARLIPNSIFSIKNLQKHIEIKSKQYGNFDDSVFISNVDGNWREKEIVERSIFGTPQIYKFNGIDVYGVEKPDMYLSCLYGNWRKLPPIADRESRHDYVELNLDKSYL